MADKNNNEEGFLIWLVKLPWYIARGLVAYIFQVLFLLILPMADMFDTNKTIWERLAPLLWYAAIALPAILILTTDKV